MNYLDLINDIVNDKSGTETTTIERPILQYQKY